MYTKLILTLPGSRHLKKTKVLLTSKERKRLIHMSLLSNPAVPKYNTIVEKVYSKVIKTIPIGPKVNTSNIHSWAEDMRLDNRALNYKLI